MLFSNDRGYMVRVDDEVQRQRRLVRRIRQWWRALDGKVPRARGQPGAWMVTLTYKHDVPWEARHISDFLKKVQHDTEVTAYAWVCAVQPGTGRPHYHVLFISGRPAWVSNRWGKGRTQTRSAWSVGYLLKYLWNQEAEGLPRGCRRFGLRIGEGVLEGVADWVWQLSKLPAWIAVVCNEMGGLARREGRVWLLDCGLVLENEWRVM